MEWLNYHHLRYFWTVAKEGSLARASSRLNVSQPSISEQIRALEEALGEKLFRREGRANKLTEAGQLVFEYAEEIFALGRELMNALQQSPGTRTLRLCVGITDSFPKLVTNEMLKPVFSLAQPVHVTCREGKLADLVAQLAAHKLDLVLSDEPVSSSTSFKVLNHPLGECGSTFCAEKKLARKLRAGFPRSLDGAAALLPAENSTLRRAVEIWFREQGVAPRVVVECEDLALMKVMAADGRGVIAVPTIALGEAVKRYGFEVIGQAESCRLRLFAITTERRIVHPGAAAITDTAKTLLKHG